MVISQRLKGALKLIGPKKPVGQGYKATQILIWELMNTQSRLDKAEAKVAKLTAPKCKAALQKKVVVKKTKKPKKKAVDPDERFFNRFNGTAPPVINKAKLPKNFGKVK